MRRWIVRIVIVLVVVAIAIGGRALFLRRDPIEVTVGRVERGTVEETITNTSAGTVKAHRRTRLSPESGGMAVEIPFDEGQFVEKGDVLLKLDSSSQRAQLTLAQRELQSASARRNQVCVQAERQEQELARFVRLHQEKIVSEDVVDEARAAAEGARAACNASEADVERARSAVTLAQVGADKTVLRAPFAGVVAEISIELGEWTSPSPPALPIPPVIDLIDPTSIYISAPMDEVDAARLEPGLRGRVTVDSHRGNEFWGTIVRVSPYVLDVEAQNRTVEIDVELDDETLSSTLKPGTSADVEIVLQTRETTLRIPTGALFEGNQVLVVEREDGERGDAEGGGAREAGRLAARTIEVGLKNWNWTEVLSGLEAGELIVATLDRAEIQPGAEVVIAKTLDAVQDGAVSRSGAAPPAPTSGAPTSRSAAPTPRSAAP